MRDNFKEATNLKQILAVLLSSVLQTNAEVSAAHETAIESITHRTNEKTEILLDAVTAAASSMAVLGNHMVFTDFLGFTRGNVNQS
jgi:archaellum component FlaF (FlaF/FlaG flagellin family)